MIGKLTSILILLALSGLFAQNADSLLAEALAVKNGEAKEVRKCAFGLFAEIKENYGKFSASQRKTLDEIFSRPECQKSVSLRDGAFVLHYDTSGSNAPTYSTEELAAALDTVCEKEFSLMGFPPPPPDNAGGTSGYDIYIQNIGGVYGYTMPEDLISPQDSAYTSFLVINSDFDNFYTEGINAAKVTLAHELHHAIQTGNYVLRYDDTYFYELTSTSMEEFVFPYVNDYIAYLPEYFNRTDKSFASYSGYNLAIWNLFLKAEFGFSIFTEQWRNMKSMRAAYAIKKSLASRGTTFASALREFGVWNYFTNFRAQNGKYYADAPKFPRVNPVVKTAVPPSYEKNFSLPPLASAYVRVAALNSARPDTLMLLAVNGRVAPLFTPPYERVEYGVIFFDNPDEGEFPFSRNYSYDFYASSGDNSVVKFINGDFATGDASGSVQVYPLPFIPQKHSGLTIELDEPATTAEVAVFSVDMARHYRAELPVWGETPKITIPKNFLNLPSGIYIFTLRYNEKTQKGKFAIINERR